MASKTKKSTAKSSKDSGAKKKKTTTKSKTAKSTKSAGASAKQAPAKKAATKTAAKAATKKSAATSKSAASKTTKKTAAKSKTTKSAKKPETKAAAKKTATKPATKKSATKSAAKTKKSAAKAAPKKTSGKPRKMPPKKKTAEPKRPDYGEIVTILKDMRSEILGEIELEKRSKSDELEEVSGDIYDQASTARDRELDMLLSERERGKLRRIDDALARIRERDYGECEMCGELIPLGRLKVMPFAQLCIDCQSQAEMDEARERSSLRSGGAFGSFSIDDAEG